MDDTDDELVLERLRRDRVLACLGLSVLVSIASLISNTGPDRATEKALTEVQARKVVLASVDRSLLANRAELISDLEAIDALKRGREGRE